MEPVQTELFLRDQFPPRYRPLIPTTLKTAYQAADAIIASEPILQVESAADNRGRIVAWAVDFGFKRLIETGQLPFDYRWQYFAKPTGRYLEMRMSHSVMSISQCSDPTRQPRDVRFRSNARMRNQAVLPYPEFEEEYRVSGLPNWLLLHGHQQLQFAHIGLPDPVHSQGYIFRTTNLMNIPHEVLTGVPPVEQTDVDPGVTLNDLKEEIDRWRRDNDD